MKKGTVSVLSALTGAVVGAAAVFQTVGKEYEKKYNKAQSYSDKHLALFYLMNQWVKVKQEGKNLSSYFEKNGYKKIAIYGMGHAGETLVDELRGTATEVAFGIDKNADSIYAGIDVVSPDEEWEHVDAIVVAAITFFDEIEEELSQKVDCPIISLEDVVYEG
jgi:lactate dehydrogenase-like 2-hydroxyacid dehydrogenase